MSHQNKIQVDLAP